MPPVGNSLPYRDSTADVARADVLKQRLAEDGYLFLRGVLPADDVHSVARHIARVAREAGWIDTTGKSIRRATANVPPGVGDAFMRMWSLEGLHRLMHAPTIVGLLAGLQGEPILVHPIKVLRVVRPVGGRASRDIAGWHQDFPELQGSPRQLTVWTPLAPCDDRSGALALIPGSHRQGLRDLELANNPSGWEAVVGKDPVHVCGALEPGDALVFTTYTVHAAKENESDRLRVSVDARYQPLDDPISVSNLALDGFGFDWPDVYRDWVSHDLQYYWKRSDVRVAQHDRRWEDWREDTAIRAGIQGDARARRALELAADRGRNAAVRENAHAALAMLSAREASLE